MSTSFSGMGCPEHAHHSMSCGVRYLYGEIAELTLLFTQKYNEHANAELELLPQLRVAGSQVPTDPEMLPCHFERMEAWIDETVKEVTMHRAETMQFEDMEKSLLGKRRALME